MREVPGPRRSGGLLQGCPSDLGWGEASVRGQASLHPLLASSPGLASLLPPGTLDCLLVRDISYSRGGAEFQAMPQGDRAVRRNRRADCGPDQQEGRVDLGT